MHAFAEEAHHSWLKKRYRSILVTLRHHPPTARFPTEDNKRERLFRFHRFLDFCLSRLMRQRTMFMLRHDEEIGTLGLQFVRA